MRRPFFLQKKLFMPALPVLGVVLGWLLFPGSAHAAQLSFSPQQISVTEQETFPVTLTLDSQGEVVNALEARIHYPAELLSVVGISTGHSFIKLWAENPAVTAPGTLSLSGGTQDGGVMVGVPVVTIMLKAQAKGNGEISFDDAATHVLLNDGSGTPASLTTRQATVAIGRFDASASRIISSTHPDQSRWYASNTLALRWSVYQNIYYSMLLSLDAQAEPDNISDATDGTAIYSSLADGVWYMSVKERLGDIWSSPIRYRAMIDMTPPKPITLAVADDADGQTISFVTTDATSGIDRYDVRIRKPRWTFLPFFVEGEWREATSPIHIGAREVLSEMTIRATDKAGNTGEVVLPFDRVRVLQRTFVFLAVSTLAVLLLLLVVIKKLLRRSSA